MTETTRCEYQFPELYFRVGIEDIARGLKVETRRPYTDTNFYYFRKMIGRIVRATDGTRNTFIIVVDVRRGKLGDMTDDDARREGYSSLNDFIEAWRRIYGGYNPETEVVIIEFVWFACEDYCPSRRRIVIEDVSVPLCRGVRHRRSGDRVFLSSKCYRCWLSPIEWCGNCAYGKIHRDKLLCMAMGGEAVVERIKLPHIEMLSSRKCEMYRRNIPESIRYAMSKLRSMGIHEIK